MTNLFRPVGTVLVFLWVVGLYAATARGTSPAIAEAPTGFDNETNGFVDQDTFDRDREEFEEREDIDEGLGPVYNAQACAECHQTPVTGGVSQVTELRSGRFFDGVFTDHPGGSLINDRAVDAAIQEYVFESDNVRAVRTSLNVLGDGFVEAIADATFAAIRSAQPPAMRGQIIRVPVAEAIPGTLRIGRFGWKNQNASLLTFSGDAYVNEMGITNALFLTENTSNGNPVDDYDAVADTPPFGEDPDDNIGQFTRFMRATKARLAGPSRLPPRPASFCSRRSAAASATRRRSSRRRRGRRSTAARSRFLRRWPARPSAPSAISCSTTSARATASCRTAGQARGPS